MNTIHSVLALFTLQQTNTSQQVTNSNNKCVDGDMFPTVLTAHFLRSDKILNSKKSQTFSFGIVISIGKLSLFWKEYKLSKANHLVFMAFFVPAFKKTRTKTKNKEWPLEKQRIAFVRVKDDFKGKESSARIGLAKHQLQKSLNVPFYLLVIPPLILN